MPLQTRSCYDTDCCGIDPRCVKCGRGPVLDRYSHALRFVGFFRSLRSRPCRRRFFEVVPVTLVLTRSTGYVLARGTLIQGETLAQVDTADFRIFA